VTITVHQITQFLIKHDIAESRFGRDVANDPRLVGDMRNLGRVPRPKLVARMRAYMEGIETNG